MRKSLVLVFSIFLLSSLKAASFEVDPVYSNISFSIKNMQISKVKGDFKDYKASFSYDAAKKEFKSMEAVIEVKSVDTNNDTRDAHLLQADFFNAKKYPTMTFKMRTYKKLADDKGVITGKLCIVGVCKDASLSTQILGLVDVKEGYNAGEKRLGFSMDGVIKRSWFSLAPKTSTLKLGDDINISINIEAKAI